MSIEATTGVQLTAATFGSRERTIAEFRGQAQASLFRPFAGLGIAGVKLQRMDS